MKVSELIEILTAMPQDLDVLIWEDENAYFAEIETDDIEVTLVSDGDCAGCPPERYYGGNDENNVRQAVTIFCPTNPA